MSEIERHSGSGVDVAIVGMGPRGLSVLERLLVRLTEEPAASAVRIWTIDPGEHGAGRVWRSSQPDWFAMNTVTGEVSLYSGEPDGGPPRAGAGPSLHQWLTRHPDSRFSALGPCDYAPRPVFGEYLASVFDNLVATAPRGVEVIPISAQVTRIDDVGGRKRLTTADKAIVADKVVLATGHPKVVPNGWDHEFLRFADDHPGATYLRGDSAAEMDLGNIRPGEPVGVIGLGLTFYDVLAALTHGRGGEFVTEGGTLRYRPSGHEPNIAAGSRSGLPMLARGRNQKTPSYRYRPRFVTDLALTAARYTAEQTRGSAQLDFLTDLFPLLQLEVEHVYYRTHLKRLKGQLAEREFAKRHLAIARENPGAVQDLLVEFGLENIPPIDMLGMARPFKGEVFASPGEYHDRLLNLLDADVAQAEQGNMDGPLKAALDILRDTRGFLRSAVDFGGLLPESHRDDFLGFFNPVNTMVSAGPPAARVSQACALLRAGVLTVVGPATEVRTDPGSGRFSLHSSQVEGSRRLVSTLIDGRIPRPALGLDSAPLTRQLLADGVISEYLNGEFATGGLAVTPAPFLVIDGEGRADPDLYAIGIPTENVRWFTQIGNGRPGPLGGFHADADAIAADALAEARAFTSALAA